MGIRLSLSQPGEMFQGGQQMGFPVSGQGPFHELGYRGGMAAVGPFIGTAQICHRRQVQVESQGFQFSCRLLGPLLCLSGIFGASDGSLTGRRFQEPFHPGHLSPFLIHTDEEPALRGKALELSGKLPGLFRRGQVAVEQDHTTVLVLLHLFDKSLTGFRAFQPHQHQLAVFLGWSHGVDFFHNGIFRSFRSLFFLPGHGPQHSQSPQEPDPQQADNQFLHTIFL